MSLFIRVGVGVFFIRSGWGKLHSLDKVTSFFASLGIPMPGANAVLVASTEFGCGILLVVGLGTRLASVPLAITMVVALLTARREDIESWNALFGMAEALYILLFAWLFVRGAGAVSIDRVLEKRMAAASK